MVIESLLALTVFSPLLGFLIALPIHKNHFLCRVITCSFMAMALVSFIGIICLYTPGIKITLELFTWVKIEKIRLCWSLFLDPLSLVMLGVVLIVSLLVHIYSMGYMAHDPGQGRFMSYLSLFTFMMLMLVTSANLLQLFFGWEGVGLSSYLLIGFWFEKPRANVAAFKAFVVNRIADIGLVLGICTCFIIFGGLEFNTIFNELPQNSQTTFDFFGHSLRAVDLIGILLLIGAIGKSAQFGFHVWLPDAMEGPTPVSALIHAATMVTAGIFLIVRLSPIFEMAYTAKWLMVLIGTITAFYAATVALTQSDIKRIIAYSTCSQLGYMLLACGCGAYAAAIFHLVTHAFFKALLFLGSGSVIHAMSDEQDIQNMGGLYKLIPQTYILMWIGSLAIAGIPFFAGYFSKDAIIEAVHLSGNNVSFWMALGVATLTSFYSWRLLLLVFHGNPKGNEQLIAHVHESPQIMLVPLYVLAIGSIFGGWIGSKWLMDQEWGFNWGNIIPVEHELTHSPEWVLFSPTIASLLGILITLLLYARHNKLDILKNTALGRFLYNKWYIDELYKFLFVKPFEKISNVFAYIIDKHVIDHYGPDGVTRISYRLSEHLRHIQTGYLFHYAIMMIVGLMVLIAILVVSDYSFALKNLLRLP
jgi:NADH-quinone oxidoreductase subunit L